MKFDRTKFINSIRSGLQKGWQSFVWLLKILVPISFLTLLLAYSGWLNKIDFLLAPLMHLLSLPPEAALPLLIGLFAGIYGGIAAMAALPFSPQQMTLMAIFLLISHNLFQESIIQGRSGLHGWTATIVRLSASVFAVLLTIPFLDMAPNGMQPAIAAQAPGQGLLAMIQIWCGQIFLLSCKIFIIIMALMVLLELMKAYDLIRYLRIVINPLMRLMGLDRQAGFLWLTAAVFGLSYGGAIIVDEVKAGQLSKANLKRLHLSIGINHSLIEDPFLFMSLGIGAFWLWIPRLITAVIFVWAYTLIVKLSSWLYDRSAARINPAEEHHDKGYSQNFLMGIAFQSSRPLPKPGVYGRLPAIHPA